MKTPFEHQEYVRERTAMAVHGILKSRRATMEEDVKFPTKKVVSSTGKVHLAQVGVWKNGNVDPLCNWMSWRGDYWGQPWKECEDQTVEITCKNCKKV